ncbi:DUF6371 domain-containing protein [Pontibacter indicus]|uniref:Toprim-like n=1 Tax=Pontibacter indicus TaxID=1317125 RepID=A0A1R3XS00_9BACT|nr:DUF6371 domain-containing protein [Pontibacter indicus]SIT94651.1 hypothetical protein SAMN05444128_3694 [Pontibacter indicus]
MNNDYRFCLEPYAGKKSRHTCPSCEKRNEFTRYIDMNTEQYLNANVGRCNRISKCSYHYTPSQYFENNPDQHDNYVSPKEEPLTFRKGVSYVPDTVFRNSLRKYDQNNFVAYINTLFSSEQISQLISRYFIGTAKRWKGATVFYQVDTKGRVRAGKIIQYNPITGKRIKNPRDHVSWVHSALKLPDYNLEQCFFGEHLLSIGQKKTVAIVESEKTAIVASVYFPELIWLAAGSINGLSYKKCQVLRGREIILYPDLNGFEEWSNKAIQLSNISTFEVSDILERWGTEVDRKNGLDLADFLIRVNQQGIKP